MENKFKNGTLTSEKINNVVQNFTKVLSFCPSSILRDARRKMDVNVLFCGDPLTNEFLRLDHEIYIDKDDEDVKKFGDAVFNCMSSLCNLMRYINNDLKFTAIPSGSFPLNVKIENLDEFDYLLVYEKQIELQESDNLLDCWLYVDEMKQLSSEIFYLMREVLIKFEKNENVRDIKLIQKDRAINVQFSWLCSSKHRHSVSIDLAIAIRISTTVQEFFRLLNFPLKDTPFEQSIDFSENMYWNFYFSFGVFDRSDTNVFDKQLFETCDRVSPNIRLCYRVLKFIRDYFFPRRVKNAKNDLTLSEISYTTNMFSSYLLKQILFQEVIEFPLCEYWKNDCILSRILSMLQKLSRNFPIIDIFGTYTIWLLDNKSDVFSALLKNMIQSLYNGCKLLFFQRENIQNDYTESLEFLLDGKVIVNLPKLSLGGVTNDILRFFHVVMFKSIPRTVLHNGVSGGLYEAFCDILEKMDYIDLTAFSASDARKIIFLLQFSAITKNEIDSSSYSLKLNGLKEMIETYNNVLWGTCEMFFDHEDVERIQLLKARVKQRFNTYIRLEEIFSAMTWEERGFIYNCLDELQFCWDYSYCYLASQASEAMKQLLDKVLVVLKKPSMYNFEDPKRLWILVTLNFLKNIK